MKTKLNTCVLLLWTVLPISAVAQENVADSVLQHTAARRLSLGGYGEVTLSRNFYSDSPFRYSSPSAHKSDPAHGRFDIPHAVLYLNYDFGRGWTFGTEVEFEHGGAGGAVEREGDEGGEWEAETEKGGEVELEQFWLQKSWGKAFNVRAGHIVVPFGLTNAHHEPLNFFTVHRPEGENTILPCTWHQTGLSVWGWLCGGRLRYEAQLTSGLDAMMFDRQNWIHYGADSPYEFEVANRYGFLARLDGRVAKGLRVGLSGYYGQTMHNSFPNDNVKYRDVKGNVYLGALDFTLNLGGWQARGNADYGYVSDAKTINSLKANQSSGKSPYRKAAFGAHAVATSVEAGYDVLRLMRRSASSVGQLYVFAHYGFYESYVHGINKYTQRHVLAGGLNYHPLPQVCVKAEYKYRMFRHPYNDEPAVNLGVCYQGFFK